MTWNGAGFWLIVSQSRQVNFSRTYWSTLCWRGMLSSVSVTVSPSLASRLPPQHVQAAGPGRTIRSRGRWSGKGWRAGRLRVAPVTVVARAFSIRRAPNSTARTGAGAIGGVGAFIGASAGLGCDAELVSLDNTRPG